MKYQEDKTLLLEGDEVKNYLTSKYKNYITARRKEESERSYMEESLIDVEAAQVKVDRYKRNCKGKTNAINFVKIETKFYEARKKDWERANKALLINRSGFELYKLLYGKE